MQNEKYIDIQSLQEQLNWITEQDRILEKIEGKLYKMKELAEYASENKLTSVGIKEINSQMDQLKKEVKLLERRLNSFH